ncbi:hypothetical protein LCGC14_2838970 [marine sediment metagenome]|uniref:Uncharacterized protein n=1 Tax=marine sediment metagenome TaxID=412755 RepID=A0A0F8YC15_9ZZZZ
MGTQHQNLMANPLLNKPELLQLLGNYGLASGASARHIKQPCLILDLV